MELNLIFALKKVLGGIVSIFLISGILKCKAMLHIDSIRKHIKDGFTKNAAKATRYYGNDIEAFIEQNYPDNVSFKELVIVNAFRPLLVLILISALDLPNVILLLFTILLILLIFPIEGYYGDKWKGKNWYILIIISLWLSGLVILTASNYYSTHSDKEIKSKSQNEISNKKLKDSVN